MKQHLGYVRLCLFSKKKSSIIITDEYLGKNDYGQYFATISVNMHS